MEIKKFWLPKLIAETNYVIAFIVTQMLTQRREN